MVLNYNALSKIGKSPFSYEDHMHCWRLESSFGLSHLTKSPHYISDPGPDEVLVKMKAISFNFRDLLVMRGIYNPKQSLPFIPGSDGAGDVVAVGNAVKNFKIGDRVIPTFSQNWIHGTADIPALKSTLGSPLDGTFCEMQCFKAQGLISCPPSLNYEEAATLPCAALTAFNALTQQKKLMPGDTILIQGLGGVSVFALHFAKALGLKAIVISSCNKKIEKASKLGAIHTINYKNNPAWEKKVLKYTNGAGVDLVVEVGGAATLAKGLRCLKRGGVSAVIGVLSGNEIQFNLTLLLMNELSLNGVFVGSRALFDAMNRVIHHANIRPTIDRVFSFDDMPTALEYFAAQKHMGKVCIRVN